MQRQSDRSRGLLQRLQAGRHKREADSAATDRAAWTEHCAIGMMAGAAVALAYMLGRIKVEDTVA